MAMIQSIGIIYNNLFEWVGIQYWIILVHGGMIDQSDTADLPMGRHHTAALFISSTIYICNCNLYCHDCTYSMYIILLSLPFIGLRAPLIRPE